MERDEELNVFLLAKNSARAHERLNEDARFVAIQRELGCRPGELSGLLRHDIDLRARALPGLGRLTNRASRHGSTTGVL
jgi:integrase